MGGFYCATRDRLRAIGVALWCNRTKVIGYAGVITGSIYMAILQGQHWQLVLFGAIVAGIGHYNDGHHGNA